MNKETIKNQEKTKKRQPSIKFDAQKFGKTHLDIALKHYFTNPYKNKQIGSYFIQDGTLSFREAYNEQTFRCEFMALVTKDGQYIGNSQQMELQFQRQNQYRRGPTKSQQILEQYMPMIPFNAFTEAGLDITQTRIIAEGPEEYVIVIIDNPDWSYEKREKDIPEFIDEKRHFTGAKLFKIQNKYFLFDIDREEIKHKLFNPFLVELPKKANTIEEAYQILKPKEVIDAEMKGLKILRQGEWFFIPTKLKLTPQEEKDWNDKLSPVRGYLKAGNNRPHYTTKMSTHNGQIYVSGRTTHSGREHKEINLGNVWWFPIANTAINSVTIIGDVD